MGELEAQVWAESTFETGILLVEDRTTRFCREFDASCGYPLADTDRRPCFAKRLCAMKAFWRA